MLSETLIGLWVQQVVEADLCKGCGLMMAKATPGASACSPQVRWLHFRGQRQEMLHSRGHPAERWDVTGIHQEVQACAVLCTAGMAAAPIRATPPPVSRLRPHSTVQAPQRACLPTDAKGHGHCGDGYKVPARHALCLRRTRPKPYLLRAWWHAVIRRRYSPGCVSQLLFMWPFPESMKRSLAQSDEAEAWGCWLCSYRDRITRNHLQPQ